MTRQLEAMQRTQDRFAQVVGATAEARMRPVVEAWLESKGFAVLDPLLAWSLDGLAELDGVARAQGPQGIVWILASAKARIQPGDVVDLASVLRRPEVQRRLQAEGVTGILWPVVFGPTAERRVIQVTHRHGVGLLIEGEGEVVPPEALVV